VGFLDGIELVATLGADDGTIDGKELGTYEGSKLGTSDDILIQ